DALVAQGLADPDRLGVMGWSQGGYISAFLATHTDRFKAISVGAGISDWTTYYVNTDITPFTRQYLKATPWDDPEIYARTSPITTIRQAKTPTLIQHGEARRRLGADPLRRGALGDAARGAKRAAFGSQLRKSCTRWRGGRGRPGCRRGRGPGSRSPTPPRGAGPWAGPSPVPRPPPRRPSRR